MAWLEFMNFEEELCIRADQIRTIVRGPCDELTITFVDGQANTFGGTYCLRWVERPDLSGVGMPVAGIPATE